MMDVDSGKLSRIVMTPQEVALSLDLVATNAVGRDGLVDGVHVGVDR